LFVLTWISLVRRSRIRSAKCQKNGSIAPLVDRAGVDLDELEGMDRNNMIDRWAKLAAIGADK
jgi:hypothetical protein